jgi:hypothetical protein
LDPTSNHTTNQDIEPVPVGRTLRNLVAYITLKLNLLGGILSLLHHEKKQNAPPPRTSTRSSSYSPTVTSDAVASPLGIMPHQIRGYIVTCTMMTPTVPAFCHCTGCSDSIKDKYIIEEELQLYK